MEITPKQLALAKKEGGKKGQVREGFFLAKVVVLRPDGNTTRICLALRTWVAFTAFTWRKWRLM